MPTKYSGDACKNVTTTFAIRACTKTSHPSTNSKLAQAAQETPTTFSNNPLYDLRNLVKEKEFSYPILIVKVLVEGMIY